MTIEKINEAVALIKALVPKEAPEDCHLIRGVTGLNIIKNNMMPDDTIMVSKRLFDMIFESAQEQDNE